MNIASPSAQKRMSRMTPEELKDLFGLQELPASPEALDPAKLPDEDLQAFSYEGLGFEEAAEQLWRHTKILHYHAGTYNRQSEWFPAALTALEKDIRLAGSFCLTRAVLETKGYVFKEIGNFTIESLRGLTAFYFRKCGQAFEDIYYTAGLVSLPMHDWERRWFLLGERLKATGEKIRKIRAGEIRAEELLKRAEAARPEKKTEGEPEAASEAKPLTVMGGALPLIGSYARQALRERKEEARAKRRQERIDRVAAMAKAGLEKLERENQKSDTGNQNSLRDLEIRKEGTGKQDPGSGKQGEDIVTVQEKRRELIREAKERGGTAEMMRIAAAPPEEILRRWDERSAKVPRMVIPPGKRKKRKK